jgi:hypothetical protein
MIHMANSKKPEKSMFIERSIVSRRSQQSIAVKSAKMDLGKKSTVSSTAKKNDDLSSILNDFAQKAATPVKKNK